MMLKSINLKQMVVTAPAAWIPQFLSKASMDPVPYRLRVSPSSSDRWSSWDLLMVGVTMCMPLVPFLKMQVCFYKQKQMSYPIGVFYKMGNVHIHKPSPPTHISIVVTLKVQGCQQLMKWSYFPKAQYIWIKKTVVKYFCKMLTFHIFDALWPWRDEGHQKLLWLR